MLLSQNKYLTRVILLGLVLAIFAIFWPVTGYDFICYDDQKYVTTNRVIQQGLTWEGLSWAFQAAHASNWHPLTWISHMLDVQFYGLRAGGHHLTNLLLHITNAVLLLLLLKRMTGAVGRSAFVAALFALHPMHIESVAWVAERKDVLSTFFFLLTLSAYTRFAQQTGGETNRPNGGQNPGMGGQQRASWCWYGGALVLFTLGLMSKPMLVTLPCVLLLLDCWPLQRLELSTARASLLTLRRLVLEKLPFFALSGISSVITFLAQKEGGSVASLEQLSFPERLSNAVVAYWHYLEKMFYPSKLAILYLPPQQWPTEEIMLACLALMLITALVLGPGRSRPYLAIGWFWYLGILFPVIGLVQVGSQYMADRYTYVPFIGCFIIVAWGGWELATRYRLGSRLPALGASAILGASTVLTHYQLQHWKTSETVFGHCLQVTTNNYIAHNNLGATLVNQQKYEAGKAHYTEALRINPYYVDALENMGTVLALQGDLQNAMHYLQQAAQLAPQSAETYGKLGLALATQGRIQEAIPYYRESIRLKPNQVVPCNNLAWILATHCEPQLRDGTEAIRLAEHVCTLTAYKEAMLVGTLAAAYAEAGRFNDAVDTAEKAIGLATAAGQQELADKNRELLALYKAGKAYHEPAPTGGGEARR